MRLSLIVFASYVVFKSFFPKLLLVYNKILWGLKVLWHLNPVFFLYLRGSCV